MVAPRQKKSHNNIVYIVLGVVIVGIVIGTTKLVGHSATTKSGADVKIMDRFFRHRELPDSENFSKPGFQLKTA